MKFRKDINGLRAIAVLAVVLFHFKITPFYGGFIGVDVFFVISGFLMTGIIFTAIRKNEFSIVNFYIARAKRIIPALVFLCIVLMLFCFFALDTAEYRSLLKNIRYSLLFVSNIHYKDTGYFDTPTQENWLLHTWSLSVEWQFYILYPLIIMLLSRYLREKNIKIVLIVVAVASFLAMLYYARVNTSIAFYLLSCRAWELLIGGLVFLFPLTISKKYTFPLKAIGLLLVIGSIFCFSEQLVWPYYYTIMPILGSALILYANEDNFLTSNIVSQFLGKVSYSLYLWHWPFAVLIFLMGFINYPFAVVIGISLSIVFALISFKFIEQFFLRQKNKPLVFIIKYVVTIIMISLVATAALSSAVKKYRAKDDHELVHKPYKRVCTPTKDKYEGDCQQGDGEPIAIVIGDSHAQMLSILIQYAAKQKTIDWTNAGCPTLKDYQLRDPEANRRCHIYSDKVFQRLADDKTNTPVIIANRWSVYIDPFEAGDRLISLKGFEPNKITPEFLVQYRNNFVDMVCDISKNRPVYLLQPIPEMNTNVTKSLSLRSFFRLPTKDIAESYTNYTKHQQLILSAMQEAHEKCKVQLLDPTPYLCTAGNCQGSENGAPLYSDNNHLNEVGTQKLYPLFEKLFNQMREP